MANSTTNIDTVVQSQASKEVTINAFFDAASPATLYGRRASTTVGLTWGYYGGNVTKGDGTLAQIANGTLGLSASTTNYIVAAKSGGAVTAATATTNWNDTTNYWRLYSVVTGTATITSYTDSRELGKMTGGGGTGSAITAKDEGSNLTTALTSVDFVGAGVTATNTGGAVTVTIPGSSGITVKDEGTNLTTSVTSIDFTGGGVAATNTGDAVTVSIAGSASITAKDEGTNLTTSLSSINFAGAGVTATNSGGDVTVTIPGGGGREVLTAARNYYVRSDGNDSNDGLSNTSGGAFLTIQKAVNVVSSLLDMATYAVTINCGDATRTEAVTLKRYIGTETPTIVGNTSTPSNCTNNTTSAHCFSNTSLMPWAINGFKFTTTTSGNCLYASGGGSSISFSNIEFGSSAGSHIVATNSAVVGAATNYTISGSASAHFEVTENGTVTLGGRTVTLSGTPAWTIGFAYGRKGHCIVNLMTFSGSATGPRFNLNLCSTVFSNGGAEASYFPGNSAGGKYTGSEWA